MLSGTVNHVEVAMSTDRSWPEADLRLISRGAHGNLDHSGNAKLKASINGYGAPLHFS